jgi:ammonium transporter, Amt family
MRLFVVLSLFLLFPLLAIAGTGEDVVPGNVQQALMEVARSQQNTMDHIWIIVAACLVMSMQLGFLFLEAGCARSKNSINVAQKNVCDFLVSVACFFLVGFGLMFGATWKGWVGTDLFSFNKTEAWTYTFFLFQAAFVGTAATIVSGAVAERMKFGAYLLTAVLISTLIYPVYGHWVWGKLLNPDNAAFLADKGFMDFAGGSVVHVVGACVSLAALLVIGPRIGRFDANGNPQILHGHSVVLTGAGVLVLLVGWLGFNGGSVGAATPMVGKIIANTLLSAAFGGVASMALGRKLVGYYDPMHSFNGVLAGLVGITAGCNAVSPHGAALIGILCGLLFPLTQAFLVRVCKIDDVVDAVAVHGGSGIFGVILAGALAQPEFLQAGGRFSQVIVQLEGIALCIAWSFSLSFAFFKIMHRLVGLRISAEEESLGLNIVEHHVTLGTGILQTQMMEMQKNNFDLTRRFDEHAGDEAGEIARLLNPFVDEMQGLGINITQHASTLNGSADNLLKLARSLIDSSDDITDTTRLVSQSNKMMHQNVHAAEKITRAINENVDTMADSAFRLSQNMSGIAKAIERITENITNITESTRSTNYVTGKAAEMSNNALRTIDSLSKASEQITDVIEIINNIAHQTNMLAMNATIEASRAGEAGKGFAVVANEVKNLAVQTAKATAEIESRIQKIQGDSKDTAEIITEISSTIHAINKAVLSITDAAEKQDEEAKRIFGTVRNASQYSEELTGSLKGISGHLQEVSSTASLIVEQSDKVSREVEQLSNRAKLGSDNAHHVEEATASLFEQATNLQESATSKFKLKEDVPEKKVAMF